MMCSKNTNKPITGMPDFIYDITAWITSIAVIGYLLFNFENRQFVLWHPVYMQHILPKTEKHINNLIMEKYIKKNNIYK